MQVLMHQEAWLAGRAHVAGESYKQVKSEAIHLVVNFLAAIPRECRPRVRSIKSSMFYPDGKLERSPASLLSEARYVSGLVVRTRAQEIGKTPRKARINEVWYALNPSLSRLSSLACEKLRAVFLQLRTGRVGIRSSLDLRMPRREDHSTCTADAG